jgi:hypothetical protein
MTIREYSMAHGHEVVGKLKKVQISEGVRDCFKKGDMMYEDEGGNCYCVTANGEILVMTIDGGCF